MNVTLNDNELRIATRIGKLRYWGNRKSGITDAKIGPQSPEETDFQGFCAEMAFCKLFNAYPAFDTGGPDKGGDCKVGGFIVDVKWTKYRSGRLLATQKKIKAHVDIYALVVGMAPSFSVLGWALKADLIDPGTLTDLGHGAGFALSQEQLYPLDILFEFDNPTG